MSDVGTSNSPQVQAELAIFTKQQTDLMAKKAPLDAERLQLQAKQNQTDADRARILELNTQISSISASINIIRAQESTVVASISGTDIVNSLAKNQLLKNILITTPLPSPGNLLHVQPAINNANLILYMTLTQHLNPYGRKRQCDTDLENLMAVINKDINNAVGVNIEAIQNLNALSHPSS